VKVTLIGFVGKDQAGKRLANLLKKDKVDTQNIVVDDSRPTTLKTRILSQGQQLLRIDREKKHSPTAKVSSELLRNCKKVMSNVDGIIISDYAKGVLTKDNLASLIHEASRRGLSIFIDPKGTDFSKYKGVTCLTPNLREAASASGVDIDSEDALKTAGKKLLSITSAKCVIITRGEKGLAVFQRGKREPAFIMGHSREVYDITGAGDTFMSYLASSFFCGYNFYDAATLANYAASITVSKLGVATVSPEELALFMKEESYLTKRKSLTALLEIVRSLKSQNKKIVFTNGCFDLLHSGHIKFLEEARNLGDVLIVAINSDKSVRRIKGKLRPIIKEDDRADILSALHFVDHVITFEEDEPISLIKAIQPDVLVKGKNLKPKEIVGRNIVRAYGGEIRRLPFHGNISTDHIIDTIRKEK
jgi:D-beta-D-heptose 7-phosphate kinase/D-beta-D-heptose 1-phosphate adenosyltransferase